MTDTGLSSLASFVIERRKALRMSQAEAAKASGLSPAWFGRLEAGTMSGEPKLPTLEKLAKGLRVPLGDLIQVATKDKHDQLLREIACGFAPPTDREKLSAIAGGIDVPSDSQEPPDEWELELLHRIGAMDYGDFDPRRNRAFWYLNRSDRRRTLRMLEDLWFEEQEQVKRKQGK